MPNLVKTSLASIIILYDLDCPSVKYLFVNELYVTNLSRIMSSIIAQQTKLDLELVPKEKRLEIGKCNRRINPRKKQREPTFQVVLDALALTLCYSAFLITVDVPEVYMHQFWDSIHKSALEFMIITDIVVDQMHQPWRTFATINNISLSGKTTGLDKLRLSRAKILWGMYYKKNVDYVELLWEDFTYQIDNKGHKKQDKILPKSLTSPEMREFKAYKTYLGNATGATPPKKAQKFKKTASPQRTIVLASYEEPTRKSKRVKRPAKKSEGSDQERNSSDDNTQSESENGSDSRHETNENESGFEFDQEDNEEEVEDDEEEKDEEFVKTPSNSTDDEDETNDESKVQDKAEGDEDEGMDYTNQFDNDLDLRMNEPVTTDEGFILKEGSDVEITNVQQGNENPEITLNQVIDDAHVTLSTIP
ncbi:hypothetical protein Tco_0683110 [Tanacetum coccineum]|uniref:Uncharacterized protein n=1 Tax=Tanacetum coccineum TaxID=301880 RepID=A0ABQ4XUQ1_9ASTR